MFEEMAAAERAFAARALVVGWKQSFLEFFADAAVGFDGGVGPARDQIRANPDPPAGFQLLWEPRYGDVAASGDLGFLTGPVTSINPARNPPVPRYSTYASVWKRQPDGSFKVVLDVGVPAPSQVPFPSGLVQADRTDRFTGTDTAEAATRSLETADEALTKASLSSLPAAYAGKVASGGRLHRPNVLPLVGETAIQGWLGTQPAWASGASEYAESARTGDLGYTWGRYTAAATAGTPAESGFYARVWTRSRDGSWKVALDVLQPSA